MIGDGIVKRGHFLLTSGNHSHLYVNKDKILLHTDIRQDIIELYLLSIKDILNDIDVVISPAVAGISWGSMISSMFNLPFTYTEKQGDEMVLRKSFQSILNGNNVLIVEDIVSTGSSIKKVVNVLRSIGAHKIYASAIWDRMNSKYIKAIFKQKIKSWAPENCPMCKSGRKLIDPKTDEMVKLNEINHILKKDHISIILKDTDRMFIYDLDKIEPDIDIIPYSCKIFNGTFKEFKEYDFGDECMNVGLRITSNWDKKFNAKLKMYHNKFCFLDNKRKKYKSINLKQL